MNRQQYVIGLTLVALGCLFAIPLLHAWIDDGARWPRIPLLLCGIAMGIGCGLVTLA